MITLKKTIKHAKILNPLKNFQEDTMTFEYRSDPLTGRNTTVIPALQEYIKRFLKTDPQLLNTLIEEAKKNAPSAQKT